MWVGPGGLWGRGCACSLPQPLSSRLGDELPSSPHPHGHRDAMPVELASYCRYCCPGTTTRLTFVPTLETAVKAPEKHAAWLPRARDDPAHRHPPTFLSTVLVLGAQPHYVLMTVINF